MSTALLVGCEAVLSSISSTTTSTAASGSGSPERRTPMVRRSPSTAEPRVNTLRLNRSERGVVTPAVAAAPGPTPTVAAGPAPASVTARTSKL